MKTKMIVGILLIAVGVVAFAYQGFTFKTREKAIDLGSVQVTTEKTNNIPLSPVVGVISLVVGVALLVRSNKLA